jgi:plasmid maintenance system killer protein
MKYKIRNRRLGKQLEGASSIKKHFGVRAKLIVQRLEEIESSPNLKVLMQIPAANCHPLKGQRAGQWALDISGNYRIVFEIMDDPLPMKNEKEIDHVNVKEIHIVEISDYH